jgi:hypothetical protein
MVLGHLLSSGEPDFIRRVTQLDLACPFHKKNTPDSCESGVFVNDLDVERIDPRNPFLEN